MTTSTTFARLACYFLFCLFTFDDFGRFGVSGAVIATTRKAPSDRTITPPATVITPTLSYNFTLAAVNTTLPNSNSTGVPLVLGQNGATSGITFHVTSTYFSYPYNDYPSLALINGALRAYSTGGEWMTNSTGISPWDGTLEWETTTLYTEDAPTVFSAVWRSSESISASGISDGDGDDIGGNGISSGSGDVIGDGIGIGTGSDSGFNPSALAELGISVNNGDVDVDGWWLCHDPKGGRLTQTNVVFNTTAASEADSGAGGGGGDTWAIDSGCYRVQIHILPLV
ncbi:hypothetical protein BDN72DRAFT_899386 [Pluteus cervinus]|uniref:Uncharacterized protein n=1 Tax=Pluteus cervinus TaxID=181527 RepID=A0ACD3AMY5_9AGAR|nr:hypothetical protein BDN72DRAFT_899386 [Pluteus cervinus]